MKKFMQCLRYVFFFIMGGVTAAVGFRYYDVWYPIPDFAFRVALTVFVISFASSMCFVFTEDFLRWLDLLAFRLSSKYFRKKPDE